MFHTNHLKILNPPLSWKWEGIFFCLDMIIKVENIAKISHSQLLMKDPLKSQVLVILFRNRIDSAYTYATKVIKKERKLIFLSFITRSRVRWMSHAWFWIRERSEEFSFRLWFSHSNHCFSFSCFQVTEGSCFTFSHSNFQYSFLFLIKWMTSSFRNPSHS